MAVTFAADRFTVIGSFATGTAVSQSGNDLTLSAAGAATWVGRGIWVPSLNETRVVEAVSGTTLTLDRPFSGVISSSPFQISHNIDDLAAESAIGCNIVQQGQNAATLTLNAGAFAQITAHLEIGDDSATLTYFKFRRDIVNFNETPSGTGNDSVIYVRGNALFQCGDIDANNVPYNNPTLSFSQEGAFNDLMISVEDETNIARLKMFGTVVTGHYGYSFATEEDLMGIEFKGNNADVEIRRCDFQAVTQIRAFSDNVIFDDNMVTGVFVIGGQFTSFLRNQFDIVARGLEFSTSSPVGTYTIRDFTFNLSELLIAERTTPIQFGSLSIKGVNRILNAIDCLWDGQPYYQNPDGDVLAAGSSINDINTISINVSEDGVAQQDFDIRIAANVGNITTIYEDTSDVSGDAIIEVTTGVWDDTSPNSPSADPVIALDSLQQLVRIRKYGSSFIEEVVDFTNPDSRYRSRPVNNPVSAAPNVLISQTELVAQAHTGITIVEEVSPVSFQGGNFSITVIGNLTTNPSLTNEDIFHYLQFVLASNDAIGGQASGLYFHELMPTPNATALGNYYDPSTQISTPKGVRVVDENGDAIVGIPTMIDDSGTAISIDQPTLVTFE